MQGLTLPLAPAYRAVLEMVARSMPGALGA